MQEVCYAVHAEQNAIIQAAKLGVSLEGAVMYVTQGVILEAGEEDSHQQDDEERGQATGDGGHHTTLSATQPMAREYGDVDGKEPGSRLCQCDDVDEVLIVQPLALDELALYRGNHRDASTNGEGTNLCEHKKYLPETNHVKEGITCFPALSYAPYTCR